VSEKLMRPRPVMFRSKDAAKQGPHG